MIETTLVPRLQTGDPVAIEQLPETRRVVLMLRDLEEGSTEETATHLHRARQALRTMLDPYVRTRVREAA